MTSSVSLVLGSQPPASKSLRAVIFPSHLCAEYLLGPFRLPNLNKRSCIALRVDHQCVTY